MKRFIWLILLALAACNRGQGLEDIPTQASIDDLATQTVLTQNAPPEGWRENISFPEIDANLRELPGWRYEVLLTVDGTFARTPRRTTASTRAEVWFNQLASARRVVVETSSDLSGELEESQREGVRLGPDSFLVRQNTCASNTPESATTADLSAGGLIGGVRNAVPAVQRAVINNEEVWRYSFTTEDLILPQIELGDSGQMTSSGGELWVSPTRRVVIRFWLNLEVENAVVFGSTLPVSGQVIIRYDLYDIGVVPNIAVPFGC